MQDKKEKGIISKIKLDTIDAILHQISLFDQLESEQDFQKAVLGLLALLGEYTNAERAYMFEWASPECNHYNNTSEWCKEGVKPQIDNLQNIPVEKMTFWQERFQKGETIIIHDLESVKEKMPYEYFMLKKQNIHSEIAVPLFSNKRINGFIGLDNPDLSLEHISVKLLSDVGGHLGSVRENARMIKALENQKKYLEDMLKKQEEVLAEVQLNNEIISAISKIYCLIYRMDLRTDMYDEISSGETVHRLTGKCGKTSIVFDEVCREVVAPEYQQRMIRFLNTATLAERLKNTETISTEYQSQDRNWNLARFIVKKRDAQGNITNVLYVVREINDQKTQEFTFQQQLIKAADEAKRANIAKTDFLRRMSHDIRTPINGIRGLVEIADHFPEDMEKQKECREKIMTSSGFLLDLVNNVLDMNKLESGEIKLEKKPFCLSKELHEINDVIEVQCEERGIQYIINNQNIIHDHVIGSLAHFRQILLNVTGNAVKYNRENGSISVKCQEIFSNNHTVIFEFTCQDTGQGMSEEFQKHIFEPFAQEYGNEARTKYEGTGLGLSIVKELLEYMGGSIRFSSKKGEGTTFILAVPFEIDNSVRIEEKAATDTSDSTSHSLRGKRALLVEDNEMNMEIVEFLLQNEGIITTKAWNGQEAVDLYKNSNENTFDMIFMDIMMPVMGGLEATRQIRNLKRTDAKTIPIFAMSANAFSDDIERSKNAGMNEHFTKPLEMEQIIKTVEKYIV